MAPSCASSPRASDIADLTRLAAQLQVLFADLPIVVEHSRLVRWPTRGQSEGFRRVVFLLKAVWALSINTVSSMLAMTVSAAPQCGKVSVSMPHTPFRSCVRTAALIVALAGNHQKMRQNPPSCPILQASKRADLSKSSKSRRSAVGQYYGSLRGTGLSNSYNLTEFGDCGKQVWEKHETFFHGWAACGCLLSGAKRLKRLLYGDN